MGMEERNEEGRSWRRRRKGKKRSYWEAIPARNYDLLESRVESGDGRGEFCVCVCGQIPGCVASSNTPFTPDHATPERTDVAQINLSLLINPGNPDGDFCKLTTNPSRT